MLTLCIARARRLGGIRGAETLRLVELPRYPRDGTEPADLRRRRAVLRALGSAAIAGALGIGIDVLVAYAQTPQRAASPALAQPTGNPARLLTLKERLGEKWTDEQRVDNCNVPLDKRGPKPRPDACTNPLSRSSSQKP